MDFRGVIAMSTKIPFFNLMFKHIYNYHRIFSIYNFAGMIQIQNIFASKKKSGLCHSRNYLLDTDFNLVMNGG